MNAQHHHHGRAHGGGIGDVVADFDQHRGT
jgi:hypothetical protein